jgi:hypothetical protein
VLTTEDIGDTATVRPTHPHRCRDRQDGHEENDDDQRAPTHHRDGTSRLWASFPNCECAGVPSGAFVRLASVLFVSDSIPREANRCLKRYLARSLYRVLEHGPRMTA